MKKSGHLSKAMLLNMAHSRADISSVNKNVMCNQLGWLKFSVEQERHSGDVIWLTLIIEECVVYAMRLTCAQNLVEHADEIS